MPEDSSPHNKIMAKDAALEAEPRQIGGDATTLADHITRTLLEPIR